MTTTAPAAAPIQHAATIEQAVPIQKSACYSTFRACHEGCRKNGTSDLYCRADCEIDLLRCLNSVIGDELCGACSELAHKRLIAVIGVRSRADIPWWRRLAITFHLDDAMNAVMRELRTTGGKIVTLLAGFAYAFVYNLISPYVGPRSDDGGGDGTGGIGSSVESFYDSLSTLEKSLIIIPAVIAIVLFVLWIVRDRAEAPRRLLNWLNQTAAGQFLFFATVFVMCLGVILIAVQEFRLY